MIASTRAISFSEPLTMIRFFFGFRQERRGTARRLGLAFELFLVKLLDQRRQLGGVACRRAPCLGTGERSRWWRRCRVAAPGWSRAPDPAALARTMICLPEASAISLGADCGLA